MNHNNNDADEMTPADFGPAKGSTILSLGQIDLDASSLGKEPDYDALPIIATRDLVMFPGITFPISLNREMSLTTAQMASDGSIPVGVVCQTNPQADKIESLDQLMPFGVLADVIKVFSMPDGTRTAIVRARPKLKIRIEGPSIIATDFPLTARVSPVRETEPRKADMEFGCIAAAVRETAVNLIKASSEGPNELLLNIENYPQPAGMINIVATHAPMPPEDKLELLRISRVKERALKLLSKLSQLSEMAALAHELKERTAQSMSEQQRNAFLQHQMDAIREELYGSDDDSAELRKRAETIALPEEARRVFDREITKLQRINPQNPDYTVLYTYLDLLLELPWDKADPLTTDIAEARRILDADHFGLEKVKERIVEQLAVLMNTPDGRAPIICLVGAPGVGKTSLGQSIARALGRKYQRVSLGGMHDEAELRGHRRTYIGAMPGRIIDAMRRAGTVNPVLLLDEIDKMAADFKGDPSAALLEVLDPEQNSHFHDNYVDVDYSLSKVLFIATANTLSTIQQPLLDRMEVIDISGYLLEEKLEIARRHLLPRLRAEHNLSDTELAISDEALAEIIECYTAESGVRQLDRKLAAVARKAVLARVQHEEFPSPVTPDRLKELLGVAPYLRDRYEGNDFPGVVTGLAWTAAGGEILFIETSTAPGKGEKLTLTGQLGDVMKESATIALQYVRSHADELGIDPAIFEQRQIHLHVPEGAIPKDGPSAGITMATSIASALTGRKVAPRLAMTGEITLRGRVLPVGGIKEKILAAKRAGITRIILSEQNRRNVEEIPEAYLSGLTFDYVKNVSDVFDIALLPAENVEKKC